MNFSVLLQADPYTPDGTQTTWSDSQLTTILQNPRIQPKKGGAGFSFGHFHYSYRDAANLEICEMLGLDYDDGTDIQAAAQVWRDRGLRFWLHTSFSHTPERPKFRIFLPLATPMPAGDFKLLWLAAKKDAIYPIDPACCDAARFWYGPSCKGLDTYYWEHNEGRLLDWRDMVELERAIMEQAEAERKAKLEKMRMDARKTATGSESLRRERLYVQKAIDNELTDLRGAPDGQKWTTLRRVSWNIAMLVRGGYRDDAEFLREQMLDIVKSIGAKDMKAARRVVDHCFADAPARVIPREMFMAPAARARERQEQQDAAETVEEFADVARSMERSAVMVAGDDLHKWRDRGMAVRLYDRHGEDLRYVHDLDKWLVFNGECWVSDNATALLCDRLAETCQYCRVEETLDLGEKKAELTSQLANVDMLALKKESDQVQKDVRELARIEKEMSRVFSFFDRYGDATYERGLLAKASRMPEFSCSSSDMDNEPWLLNCINGTIDLRTGQLKPFDRDDRLTAQSNVKYDPNAKCPEWDTFLKKFSCGRPELVDFILQWLFYCLTGDAQERAFVVWQGKPGSGKGTLTRRLFDILGPRYARETARGAFCLKEQDNLAHQDFLAQLEGKRMVTQSEVKGRPLDAELIKQITGGDNLYASAKGKIGKDYKPTFKLNFYCNDAPHFNTEDDALLERLRIIPCDYERTEEEKNARDFEQRLSLELPGILHQLVTRGREIYFSERLAKPSPMKVRESVTLTKLNHFREWLGANYDVPLLEEIEGARKDGSGRNTRYPYKVPASEIRAKFKAYCDNAGYKFIGRDRMNDTLASLGVEEKKIGGTFYYTPLANSGFGEPE